MTNGQTTTAHTEPVFTSKARHGPVVDKDLAQFGRDQLRSRADVVRLGIAMLLDAAGYPGYKEKIWFEPKKGKWKK